VIRTHDVKETRDAALVGDAFTRERVRTPEVEELDVTTTGEARRHLDRLGVDGTYADDAVVRVFEVSGLDRTAATLLRNEAGTYGVTAVENGGDCDGNGPLLLFGTVSALRRLAAGVDRDSLAPVLSAITNGLPAA
jgi:dihydropteroate synthase